MKISQINQLSKNAKPSKSQSFQGLWRQGKRRSDIDPILNVPKIKDTYFYYPFLDETKEEIAAAVKKVNKAEFKTENGITKYYVRECRVGLRTTFSKQEYENYSAITNGFIGKKEQKIHEEVQDKLETCPLDGPPKPASNKNIEAIL